MRAALIIAFVLSALSVSAEPRWKAELSRELVSERGDKLVIDGFSVCTTTGAATPRQSFQLQSYAEAPAGFVSRDVLISYSTMVETLMLIQFMRTGPNFGCRSIDEPIGNVDIATRLVMTLNGYQWEIKSTRDGRTERVTQPWSEVFPE